MAAAVRGRPATGRRSTAPSTSRPREAVTLMDLSPFIKVRVTRAGRARVPPAPRREPDGSAAPGKVTYTVLLDEAGGITSDLTITRLADDDFLMVDGAGTGLRTISRVRDYARAWANGARARRGRLVGVGVHRHVGAERADGDGLASRRSRVTMGRFNAAPRDDRRRSRARAPGLVRRRARLGDLRTHRVRGPAVGRAVGGRAATRGSRRSGSPRRTRCGSRRATGSGATTSTPSSTRSRPAWTSRSRWTRATSSAGTRCCASATRGSAGDWRAWSSTTRGTVPMGREPIFAGARRWAT